MSDEVQWFEVPDGRKRKAPRWARRAAVSSDGTIFIPSVVAATELETLLCAGYDNTRVLLAGGRAYYPADWMKREFPESRKMVETIENRIREAILEDEKCPTAP